MSVEGLRTFLVESYWPGLTDDELRSVVERLRGRSHGDGGVVPLASLLVPSDAMAILLVQANSLEAVRVAAADDDIPFDRVVECHAVGLVPQRQQPCR